MPDTPVSSPSSALPSAPSRRRAADGDRPRAALAKVIPRRAGVSWWLGIVLAVGFAAVVTPAITADHWLLRLGPGTIAEHREAPFTVRAPMSGYGSLRVGGGVVIARGEVAGRDEAAIADALAAAAPSGPVLYLALFALTFTLAALFTHHVRRSTKGRLVRVQVVSLAVIAVLAIAVKILLLSTALSALVVPIAVLAMVPTMALDRVVGLASGVLGALVISLLAPFDIGLALLLLVQTAVAGLVVAERPRRRPWLAALTAGAVTTLCTAATYLLLTYLASGHAPELGDPLHSPWLDAAIGPAVAALLAVPLMPFYQLLVGEITQGKLIALEDLGQPLLRQIAEKAPGTWQHSLMMANMAEIAANAIGANGRLVRVGAYYHDLGKSLQPKYFIENLEAGETSPHDLLPPEVSCDAIFAHVTEGIVAARKAGLHERIVDFMHMHHGNGVLEYFWAKCREQGNPDQLTVEDFRYPGHPPQSRETALLAICDAVEAASRTLTKPDATSIDSLVQRIVYGKLHLGQLDESGLSMGDLRRISDSLRETIRHANHGRIEYPWQKAGQDASASAAAPAYSTTAPRLDSLDRKPARDTARSIPSAAAGDLARPAPRPGDSDAALAITADAKQPAPAPHPGAETSDASRIRAGTARNAAAVPVARPEPEPAGSLDDAGTAHTAMPRASGSSNDSDVRAAFDRTDRLAAPTIPDRAAPHGFAPTTIPGRAPGSHAAEASTTHANRAADAADPTTIPDRVVAHRVEAKAMPARAPVAPTDVVTSASDPRGARPPRTAGALAPSHPLDATLRGRAPGPVAPLEPAPLPGPPSLDAAPAAPQRAAAPAPAGGGSTQIAAALANLAQRVSAAPFGKPADAGATSPSLAPQPLDPHAVTTQPLLPALASAPIPAAVAAEDPGSDPAITQRSFPASTDRDTGSDAAITQPSLAALAAPSGARAGSDAAITRPSLAALAASKDLAVRGDAGLPSLAAPARGTDQLPRTLDDAVGASLEAIALPPSPASGHPPPRGTGKGRPGSVPPMLAATLGTLDEDARVTVPRPAVAPPGSRARAVAHAADPDAGVTEPSMPVLAIGDQLRVDTPLPAAAASEAQAGWALGLAARVDAVLDDEWRNETPIVAPTEAELRALLGQPDPTRQQPIEEIERLQRRAAELRSVEQPRRAPHPTAEVDPDDIEAAIEVAPPARRATHPNAVAAVRPRKPE